MMIQQPLPRFADQKTFGSRPCPMDYFQVSWLLTSPLVAHGVGSKDVDNRYKCWVERVPIRPSGFANPAAGSPLQPVLYVNVFSGINGTWSRMM